jgi:glutathione S-transferase
MALTIYGSSRSRTMRTLWVVAELGLDYMHVPLAFDDPALKSDDFLRVNPAGLVPAIDDDGFALSESLAINLYLTKKYGSSGPEPLYPPTLEGEAEVWRWTLWAQGQLEPWVQRDALMEAVLTVIRTHSSGFVDRALDHLEATLVKRPWLAAAHFTVADLNVAGVLLPSRATHLDLSGRQQVRDWLKRCYDRPGAVTVRSRFG